MLATAKALVAVGEPEIAISDFSFFTKRSNAAELMLAGFSLAAFGSFRAARAPRVPSKYQVRLVVSWDIL